MKTQAIFAPVILLVSILICLLATVLSPTPSLAEFHSLPMMEFDSNKAMEQAFEEIMHSYRSKKYLLALRKTRKLLKNTTDEPLERAAFFLKADLEFELARSGREFFWRKALSSYQEAVAAYPSSKNTVRAYWKIGEIYREMGFFYEAIASHRRILKFHPGSGFAPLAQRGIARVYWKSGRLIEAAWEYRNTIRLKVPPSEVPLTLIEYGDVMFQLGRYERGFQLFQKGMDLMPSLARMEPDALFRYGETAFWTQRYSVARTVFTKFFNLHPRHSHQLIAVVRVGDSWRAEGDYRKALLFYTQVRTAQSSSPDWNLVNLFLLMGEFQIRDHLDPPQSSEALLEKIEGIVSLGAIGDTVSPSLHRVLFETGKLLREHDVLFPSIRFYDRFLASEPPPLIRKQVVTMLRQTLSEAIQSLSESGEPTEIISLYYRYPMHFSTEMLLGQSGLTLAHSLAQAGLLAQAIDFYQPIANGPHHPSRSQAQLQLSRVYLKMGDHRESKKAIEKFIRHYPKHASLPDALMVLGTLYLEEGKYHDAAHLLKDWLQRHPQNPQSNQVTLLLAEAYDRSGHQKEALQAFLEGSRTQSPPDPALLMRIADLHQSLGQHEEAVKVLEKVLKGSLSPEGEEWVRFRVAQNKEAHGLNEDGLEIFRDLAQRSQDPLIQSLSAQKESVSP